MQEFDSKAFAARIQQRLDATGLSPRAASLKAGASPDLIRGILRGANKSVRGDHLVALARVLDVSESWLITGFDQIGEAPAERGIRFGGIVEAGAFRPNDTSNQENAFRIIPIAPDPRYPAASQFAFEVVGDSMDNAHMYPGTWVQAVEIHSWQRLHGEPRDGTYVVVARTRNGDSERELTVKRLRIYRDRIELCPESSNPRHKPLVFPNPPKEDDVAEGQVIAIVIGTHRIFF